VIASIDISKLLELAWVAPASAIVVSLTFSLVVLGSVRASDARRAGETGATVGYGLLAAVALLAFAGLVAAGLFVIISG
jgi:hypothetical protein